MLSLSQRLRQTQTQSLEQTLLLKQLHKQEHQQVLSLRIELVQLVRLNNYVPSSTCPGCNYKLTTEEILRGFNEVPTDFTTECPKCKHRFPAQMICDIGATTIRIPFLCPMQTLYQLNGKERLSPFQLAKEFPSIYRSAIIHFKGIKPAFAKNNIDYAFEEIDKWQHIVLPYLGRLTDSIIAECVSVKPRLVSQLRKRLGIKKYCLKDVVKEQLEQY